MIDLAGKDREWIFSGIGVFLLGGFVWLLRKLTVFGYADFAGFPFKRFRVDPALTIPATASVYCFGAT
jgi:hypothetical protein